MTKHYDRGHIVAILSLKDWEKDKKALETAFNVSLNEFDFNDNDNQARFLNKGKLHGWDSLLFYTVIAMLYDHSLPMQQITFS